jgi:hypothetical protein
MWHAENLCLNVVSGGEPACFALHCNGGLIDLAACTWHPQFAGCHLPLDLQTAQGSYSDKIHLL